MLLAKFSMVNDLSIDTLQEPRIIPSIDLIKAKASMVNHAQVKVLKLFSSICLIKGTKRG